MKSFRKITDKLTIWLVNLGWPFLTLTAIVVILSIFKRLIFKSPIPGTVEIVQYGVMTAIACGIPRVTFVKAHTRVTILLEMIKNRHVRAVLDLLTSIMAIAVFGMMTYQLYLGAIDVAANKQVTEFFGIPLVIPYIILIIGLIVMLIVLFYQLAEAAYGFKNPGTINGGAVDE